MKKQTYKKGHEYKEWLEVWKQRTSDIYADYENRMPMIKLMKKYNVSSTTIYKHVAKKRKELQDETKERKG